MRSQCRRVPGFHRMVVLIAVLAVVVGFQTVLAPNAGAQGFVPVSGAGSTWAANALDQWRRNVNNLFGITVNYSPNGSTNGRNDFRNGQVDFAVSEIPYGLSDGGVLDQPPQRAFGYMPTVAGGTSFMYNLKIDGKRVTNLRLSGETIARIFTQQITNWSDPAIKADNPGVSLPDRRIVPVVYSNGSGPSAQFTAYLASQYPAIWDDYCHRNGRQLTPCGFTSFYPVGPGMEAKAQSQGSNFSPEKGRTLFEFAYYFLCEGQQQADALGYSPLPINLVQAGIDQAGQIPGSTHKLDRNNQAGCHNPTVSPTGGNQVAESAPQPQPCDARGSTQCGTGGVGSPSPVPVPIPTPPPLPIPGPGPGAAGTTTTLAVPPFAAFVGLPVFLTATVAPPTAAGTVQFVDGGSALGAPVPVIGGTAFLVTSSLARGVHSLSAVFIPADPTAFGSSSASPASLTVAGLSVQEIFASLQGLLNSIFGRPFS